MCCVLVGAVLVVTCVLCTCRGAVSLSLHPPDEGEDLQGAVQSSQLQQDGATDGRPRVHEEGKSGSSVH